MLTDIEFDITPEQAGIRLDNALLAHCPSSSRAECRRAIEHGRVLVNRHTCPKGAKLRPGDRIQVLRLDETSDLRPTPNHDLPVRVVYEDEALIAADKPAGMPVQPLSGDETGSLMNGLVARFPELAAVGDEPLMAGALHRIDSGTSGLVLAARTNAAFTEMRRQFAAREVAKIYLAIVEGAVSKPGRLEHDLAHLPHRSACKMADARMLSKPGRIFHAVTEFRPIRSVGSATLLEVAIRTGVTHQIRAQLALAGIPIINDTLYGAKPVAGMTGHLLHALSVEFKHPVSGVQCKIATGFPERFNLGGVSA